MDAYFLPLDDRFRRSSDVDFFLLMQQHHYINHPHRVYISGLFMRPLFDNTTSKASTTSFFTKFFWLGVQDLFQLLPQFYAKSTILEQISSSSCCACDIYLALYLVMSTLAAITSQHTFLLIGGARSSFIACGIYTIFTAIFFLFLLLFL